MARQGAPGPIKVSSVHSTLNDTDSKLVVES
jgi:hypothetical protein